MLQRVSPARFFSVVVSSGRPFLTDFLLAPS